MATSEGALFHASCHIKGCVCPCSTCRARRARYEEAIDQIMAHAPGREERVMNDDAKLAGMNEENTKIVAWLRRYPAAGVLHEAVLMLARDIEMNKHYL